MSTAHFHSEPALSLQCVACTFASRGDASQRYTAVQDVTLTVGAGEFVAVVGPTGFAAARHAGRPHRAALDDVAAARSAD